MHCTAHYQSPLGDILLAADDVGAVGLWFQGARYYARCLSPENAPKETPVLQSLRSWLDVYFSGRSPDFRPPIHMVGTPFQIEVWRLLQEIPYGATTTYGALAAKLAKAHGKAHMSARAVGAAVGKNNLGLIVPCHRVVGADGSPVGYAGGIERKLRLLKLEGGDQDGSPLSERSTAP